MANEELLEFIMSFGQRFNLDHFSSKVAIQSYINRCKEISKILPPKAKVLDWGAGFGQNTYILANMGFEVVHYDIAKPLKTLSEEVGITPVIGESPVLIPFADNFFDAVISCGVLEHVENEEKSLKEIKRVLKPQKLFFIFNLPYRYSPSEFFVSNFFKNIYHHERKYTASSLEQLLIKMSFRILSIDFENGIPKNLTPIKPLRPLYNRYYKFLLKIDNCITKTSFLNKILSNSIRCIAQK